jgi:hypothetical protein
MTAQQSEAFDGRVRHALAELESAIVARYPSATFEVSRGADDPGSIHLITTVDLDDPDEVGDLVIDRLIELQVDEGLPIHVIPVRTPERIAADLEAYRRSGRQR